MEPEERNAVAREILTIRAYPGVTQVPLLRLPFPSRQPAITHLLRQYLNTDDKLRDALEAAREGEEQGEGSRKRKKKSKTKTFRRRNSNRKSNRRYRKRSRRKPTRKKRRIK